MRRLGLIGGVSPEATIIYYRLLNKAARAAYGGDHSAKILLATLDFGEIHDLYDKQDWDAFAARVADAGQRLERAGAEALMISSNTTHIGAAALAEAVSIPVIHMLDVLSAALHDAGCQRPLLLGTSMVMTGDFYRPALQERYRGEVIAPKPEDCALVNKVIFDELVHGEVNAPSRVALQEMIGSYDVDGVILGCTELCMILSDRDLPLPVFDTTSLHAAAGARFALETS